MFVEWLEHHFPLRASHVMSLVRQMRDGLDYDPDFRTRMRGTGIYSDLIHQRFKIATRRLNLKWTAPRWTFAVSSPGPQASNSQLF